MVKNPGEAGFDVSKPKYYVLDMFPYPSGAGLHVGHTEGYTATDILSRMKRKQGCNVLHPMGWDAFGLPAEQYAIKTGQHPRVTTEANVNRFREQLKRVGFSYDWSREVNTTDPKYCGGRSGSSGSFTRPTLMRKRGKARPVSELEAQCAGMDDERKRAFVDGKRLAYVAEVPVNWCPELGTVLANEEVIDGKSEVGGFPVERKPMRQWMLRITAFAERLIDELEGLDWPDGIKALQRNWIGRSEGAEVDFGLPGREEKIRVFTTRPDTLFGATYMVLAPEHPLVDVLVAEDKKEEVAAYRKEVGSKSDLERTDLAKGKSGVFTGAYAVNPVNGEEVPIWIADYVLMSYGTGAIMAVPAHDERDFEFATKFGIEIREVVRNRSVGVPPARTMDERGEVTETKHRLPHWQQGECACFVTWRLADSLPTQKLKELEEDRDEWKKEHPEPWSEETESEFHRLFSNRIGEWLDEGAGECLLRESDVAGIVRDALEHFNGERYLLHAAVVMPNHVHVLFSPLGDNALPDIVQSWKSFTAKEINGVKGREGKVWQSEYFDRLIRNEAHFERTVEYILDNPKKAGLREGEFVSLGGFAGGTPTLPYVGAGTNVNSGMLDGLETAEAKKRITAWLEEKGCGEGKVNYKLRDWLFARQRYWGEPFPIVWEDGHHRAVPEEELPVQPPEMSDFKPTGTPDPPLSKAGDWVKYSETAKRELNTMPQWAGSCWYYLRFCDPNNAARPIGEEADKYWMGGGKPGGVDLYVGGTEHAVLHLLYARFWHKVLFDLGHVSTPEPFQRLVNQGIILGEDGVKMSKSRGNIVSPDDVIEAFGADSLRLFEMFAGPLEQVKPWASKGVEGVNRFLARVWRLVLETEDEGENWEVSGKLVEAEPDKKLRKVVHETIKKVAADTDSLSFNTAIAQLMVCTNALTQEEARPVSAVVTLLQLLNPYAPHLTEEVYYRMRGRFENLSGEMLCEQGWPEHNEEYLIEDEVEMVVQVNGKLRDKITVALDAAKEDVEAAALGCEKVKPFTDGKTVRKVIVVPGRLVNIVAN